MQSGRVSQKRYDLDSLIRILKQPSRGTTQHSPDTIIIELLVRQCYLPTTYSISPPPPKTIPNALIMDMQLSQTPHDSDSDTVVSLSESSLLEISNKRDINLTDGKTADESKGKSFLKRSWHHLWISYQRSHFPNPVLVLSTLWVVTASAGLAVTFLIWIVHCITQPRLSEIWKEGAFLLDEGTYMEGGFEASRLMGLTIASASVSHGVTYITLLFILTFNSPVYCCRDSYIHSPFYLRIQICASLVASWNV